LLADDDGDETEIKNENSQKENLSGQSIYKLEERAFLEFLFP
jgi:hypothetical protein